MIRRQVPRFCAWVLVVAGLLSACGGRTETPVSPLSPSSQLPTPSASGAPAPDGAALLSERCGLCHTLERVENARKTAGEWEQTVARMVGRGAQLTEEERQALIAYLAAQYGR